MSEKQNLDTYREPRKVFDATRILTVQIVVVALAAVYFMYSNTDYLNVFNAVLLASLGAVALNLLIGTVGLVSIGNSAFLAVGAFSSVFAMKINIPFPLDVAFAGVVAALAGLIIGLPAVRLRGLELALATLAGFFVIDQAAAFYQLHNGGGSAGFLITTLYASYSLDDAQKYWAITLVLITAVLLIAATRVSRGRAGRAWRLIRENEIVAQGVGVPVTRYKMIAFSLTSAVIGIEGSLTAHFSGSISFEAYTLTLAISYLAMVTIGGFDSIFGAIAGAAVVIGLPVLVPNIVGLFSDAAQDASDAAAYATIIYGALIVLVVTAWRRGLAGLATSIPHTLQRLRTRNKTDSGRPDTAGRA